jgi:teichuronic acid biosynthesis glycosyltransferase TuaG
MSLVTIIIPYFKKKNYIKLTIKSILKQKFQNYEILIVYDDDDKSDLNLIYQIKKLDNRIKVIINKKNIGAGLSRNKAIKVSRGKFIAFIDSDDLWDPLKLQIQISFMKKNNISISHTSYHIIDENNKKISYRTAKDLNFKDLIKSCDVGLSTVVINKKLLKKDYFVNLKTKEDYVLWLKLAKKNHIFYGIKKPLVFWRSMPDSLSSSLLRKLIDGYSVYRVYIKQTIFQSLKSLTLLSINYLKK